MTHSLPRRRFQYRALRTMPIAAIVIASVFTPPNAAAQAQATAPAPPTALPTVTVTEHSDPRQRSSTGTKTDTPLIETPQSISVIPADRMTTQGVTNVKEALSYSPGVIPTRFGADSRYDWISLRGFDAYAPGFYLDGMPLRNNGNWGIWPIESYGAERIELLRGPASVLYGQSGPGGLVNAVSKRPTAEPLREVQAQVGDHGRKQIAGDFSGPLREDGTLLYRLTALTRDAELPAGGMKDDRTFIAPSLTWKPSSDTSLTLLSQFGRTRAGVFSRTRPAVGSLVPTAIGTFIPSGLFASDPTHNRFDLDTSMVGTLFEHRINEAFTVRQNARYSHLDVDYSAVQGRNFITVNPANPRDPANFTTLRRTVSGSNERIRALNLDNQLETRLRSGDVQQTVLVGLDYQRTRIDQTSYSGGSASSLNIYNPVYGGAVQIPAPWYDGVATLAQTGFYVQDQIKWRDRWLLTLGARYDRASSEVDSRLDGSHTKISESRATKRAGLTYLAPNGWAPYVSYTESFVPTATRNPATGQPFKPETGRQYEAGVRYQPEGGKQSYSAAIFDLRRKNYLTADDNFVPRQTGEVQVRGLELEASAEVLPRLNIVGSYTYTPTAEITASSTAREIGKPLTAVSRNAAALWADYRFPNRIKVGLGARFTGSNYGDLNAAPGKVPCFTVFDAMIGYDIDRWTFALNVRNLTDKTYIGNCDQYGNCYYGDQRRVIATATYRW
ncbi:TonB-dependent siderophore receptor [Xanthomonas phaseoli]|uniref:TonB-dependent siderophore receptor n=1 Tax=Xanthomonas phaseoli TaxID=1985254 RepID=UPI001237D11A|nr:TonB-dependent siderophore receptor [Xanthomonas phaseoli]MBO9831175.1 TonB-dependent siderophore receptor [Xanthomonas phaseoli pv. dieffenbachiae]MBO9837510.1 TonB-dependent siderophore receptor [Xanthomonas phaseoli pv. dieffenbachiae]MBO9839250.1 TonB-dependent siderophore receptor [Xanthomonas phaseoli pv. dieffenbachiae]MBO9861145.1 TonB-dependent siderophore receptor [Xanthomonas phaseoli pv. dieffenbachiae]MBO9865021.1 TonB-dependent siderophore receptor [Xanthomonas phaseoli pv. di